MVIDLTVIQNNMKIYGPMLVAAMALLHQSGSAKEPKNWLKHPTQNNSVWGHHPPTPAAPRQRACQGYIQGKGTVVLWQSPAGAVVLHSSNQPA